MLKSGRLSVSVMARSSGGRQPGVSLYQSGCILAAPMAGPSERITHIPTALLSLPLKTLLRWRGLDCPGCVSTVKTAFTATRWTENEVLYSPDRRYRRVVSRLNLMKQAKVCLWCGKELPKYRRKYCSDECSQEYFVNKIAPFWWNNARRICLERAGRRCEVCDREGYLEVHHKEKLGKNEPYHNSLKNRQENLIALCRSCHEKMHHPRVRQEGYQLPL